MLRAAETIGRRVVGGAEEIGFAGALLFESLFWTVLGRSRQQPVRAAAVAAQTMQVGIQALPIVTILAATIGMMLAIQSLYTLSLFGAEAFATVGIALSVVREFSPLIVGILIAGRSGSALAARLSTMLINQEIDAFRAIGIAPVRFLVAPALIAMLIAVPCLTVWANLVALGAAGILVSSTLGISLEAYGAELLVVLSVNDLAHGLTKSAIFAALVAIISSVNGALAEGGAEGVGRMTTRAVVQSIAAIIIADMIFAFIVTSG
ncbi:MAG: ABC transporter permease [Alphaproteobacteria bacterium]|jgi:phospholipid/cholesterol/gamma-HCH transport system permease protein|nr:ABC transporter permease [Alphaproteobacteria bacterium]